MNVKLKAEEAPRGRRQRTVWRAIYPERDTRVRIAIDRAARIDSAIVEMLRAVAIYKPELAHGLTQDAE